MQEAWAAEETKQDALQRSRAPISSGLDLLLVDHDASLAWGTHCEEENGEEGGGVGVWKERKREEGTK